MTLGHFKLYEILGLHVALFFGVSTIAIWQLQHLFFCSKPHLSLVIEQLHYAKWIALGVFFLILQAHLAIPALTFFKDTYSAGIYAAGANLLFPIDYTGTAIVTVQLPSVMGITSAKEHRAFIRQSVSLYGKIAIVLIPYFFLASPAVELIYGREFQASAEIFQIK